MSSGVALSPIGTCMGFNSRERGWRVSRDEEGYAALRLLQSVGVRLEREIVCLLVCVP